MKENLFSAVAPAENELLRGSRVRRMNQHIQIRHLSVAQIRVLLFQPAPLHRQHGNPRPGQRVCQLVPLLQLDNALGQELVGPVFPPFPHRVFTVGQQLGKPPEDQRLYAVAFGIVKQLPQGQPLRNGRNRTLPHHRPNQGYDIIICSRHSVHKFLPSAAVPARLPRRANAIRKFCPGFVPL